MLEINLKGCVFLDNMENKRSIAHKINVKDVLTKPYVVQEGWEPNYLDMGIKVSRVNIVGVITHADENYKLEDESGEIMLKSFEPLPQVVAVGDVVIVIGRPREYNDERYVAPETIQKVDAKWLQVRKIELQSTIIEAPEIKEPTPINKKIIECIERLDTGNGVLTESLVTELGVDDIETHIAELLMEGEIFEIRPGVLKLLN